MSAFGDQLRSHRQAAGQTQEELAAYAGLSVRAIADMERGRTVRPYRRSVALLTEALGLSATEAARFRQASRASMSPSGSGGGQRQADPAGQLPVVTAQIPPRQLPAPLGRFVGRAAELGKLDALLGDASSSQRTVVISAIGGSAGVGKTALAVHWGHQVAGHFPDGQLYVNLRGFDPSESPVRPAAAVRGFLDALRVRPAEVPVGLDAQAGLYRSLMADRAMLVLLDNARDAEQVRALLPGSPNCMVLVTSRSPLTGLVVGAGAYPLPLGVFTMSEAADLLADRVGAERIAREKAAADEVVRACARLPLAVAIAAARAAGRPRVSLADLAAELRDSRHLLDALETADAATSPRSVISWSYLLLSPSAARMFRLIGEHPGPDLSTLAAASLAGVPAGLALTLLEELCEANLLAAPQPGRFSLHDLLRAYASERGGYEERAAERDAAIRRVLVWYLHSANAAARAIDPGRRHVDLDSASLPVEPMTFAGHDDALEWLESESTNLLAAVTCASQRQEHEIAWQLPVTLWDLFNRRSRWADWIKAVQTGLASAERLCDLAAQGWLLNHLAIAHQQGGDSPTAISCFERAVVIRREQQDRLGEANVLANLGRTYSEVGMQEEAMECLTTALTIFNDIGKTRQQGMCWSLISGTYRRLGQFEDAVTSARRALDLIKRCGDEPEESGALVQLASADLCLGQPEDAIAHAARAAELSRRHGDRRTEAEALIILGQACTARGHSGQARRCRHDAYMILCDLGVPRAATLAGLVDDPQGTARPQGPD